MVQMPSSSQEPWQPFEPGQAWNLKWAGHLLRRIGFGPTWPELQKALALGPQKTIDQLVSSSPESQDFHQQMDQWESSADALPAFRAWWLRRMLETPQPLGEKITLFWYNHLALGNVRNVPVRLLRDYLRAIRRCGLGRLEELLRTVVLQPAMLLSHGAEANRKARPCVHFARIVLENFTVGPGEFTEKDVHATARALTGWFVLRDELRFIDREYDAEPKTLLGQSGPIGAEELFRLLAQHPATAKTVVRKLYQFFVSEAEEPDGTLLDPLAGQLTQGVPIGKVVEIMLRSKWFFSQAAYRRRVKSPVEWALGVLRPMGTLVPTEPLGQALVELGQDLGDLPTPAGWPGGIHWISPPLMLLRGKWAEQFWMSNSSFGQKLDPAALADRHGSKTPSAQADFLLKLYLQDDLPSDLRTRLLKDILSSSRPNSSQTLRHLVQTLVLLPEFQLA